MKLNRLAFGASVCFLILAGCNRENTKSQSLPYRTRQTTLLNNSVGAAISEYIEEKNVDVTKSVITLSFNDGGVKQLFSISQFTQKSYRKLVPDYYFIHDSKAVVLVYVMWNKFLSAPDITREVDDILEKRGVILSDQQINFDPPTWEVISCGGNMEIIKNQKSTSDFVPCGYEIKQDSLDYSRYYLIRKNP